MSDTIQEEIDAKATAPRVMPADIEANIIDEVYFTALDGYAGTQPNTDPDYRFGRINSGRLGLLTFCVLVLRNGHTVAGESHCQDPDKFDAQIGRIEARKDAINKFWPMAVYAARQATQE